jgi:hypothetical protein
MNKTKNKAKSISQSTAASFFLLRLFWLQFVVYLLIACFYSNALVKRKTAILDFGQYGLGYCLEGFLYFLVVFGVNLYEFEATLFCQSLSFFESYCPFLFKVIFVADKQNFHVGVAIHLDFVEPIFYMCKSLSAGDVIHE